MGLRVGAQELYLGTKTPYVAPTVAGTPAPAGFRAVFVNYVGRHGARYLTKAAADVNTLQVLEKASAGKGLTEAGRRIKEIVARLCEIDKGQYENITLLGAEEQRAIGNRIFDGYSSAFAGKGLDVVVTYKVRTGQSADAFLSAITTHGGYTGKVNWSKKVDSLDAVLRFYDLSPAYQRYKKSPALKRALDSLDADPRTRAVAEKVCSRLFVPAWCASLPTSEALAFADDLYDLYVATFSLPEEIRGRGWSKEGMDMGAVFSKEELAWEDFRSGAQDFLEKGPGYDPLGIQVKVAAPLLVDFVRAMDKAIIGRAPKSEGRQRSDGGLPPDAVFRFTHAEAISPFAALLGIGIASRPSAGIYQYHDNWQAESVIPLSANIQWILYSDGKNYLVKVLLNEREVRLPVDAGGPYYRWEELRAYCLKRLQQVHAGLGDDMLEYLKELK